MSLRAAATAMRGVSSPGWELVMSLVWPTRSRFVAVVPRDRPRNTIAPLRRVLAGEHGTHLIFTRREIVADADEDRTDVR